MVRAARRWSLVVDAVDYWLLSGMSRRYFHSSASQCFLFSSQPQTIHQPRDRNGDGCDGNPNHSQSDKTQPRVKPGAHLIAGPVDDSVNKALGLILVFARHHGKK